MKLDQVIKLEMCNHAASILSNGYCSLCFTNTQSTEEEVCIHGILETLSCKSCNDLNTVKTEREEFDLTQIPVSSLINLGKVFKEGELKYGKGNWLNGIGDKKYQLERANHALKHLLYYIHYLQIGVKFSATTDEDHLAKVMWFCCTQIELERLSLMKSAKGIENGS